MKQKFTIAIPNKISNLEKAEKTNRYLKKEVSSLVQKNLEPKPNPTDPCCRLVDFEAHSS